MWLTTGTAARGRSIVRNPPQHPSSPRTPAPAVVPLPDYVPSATCHPYYIANAEGKLIWGGGGVEASLLRAPRGSRIVTGAGRADGACVWFRTFRCCLRATARG